MPIARTVPFLDLHVHAREPGQTHKETIETACAAAAAGGFGAIAIMANTSPPVDTPEWVRFVREKARGLPVSVYPAAAVTVGQKGEALTDFAALKEAGAAALSDDGLPIRDEKLLREALMRANAVGLPVLLHCEPETEQCEQALYYIKQTSCPAHICHVSLADTVAVLRKARREGVPFTAETCPHYMTAAFGKMNPPLGTERDIEAVLDALCDGVIDCIATDHAPHTEEEKASDNPPNGVIGLETALAVSLEALYHSGRMPLESVFSLLSENPAVILRVPVPGGVVTIETDREWMVEPGRFASKSENTPFMGKILRGKVVSHHVG
ncbi:MAG: amidohydrolase family protein [Oscillospiraceae bacterium]|jgi:dihydroorotase|nr:amidohydrolase family protein [Oscillospiraceae bacterium]